MKKNLVAIVALLFALFALPQTSAATAISCLDQEDAGAAGLPCSAVAGDMYDGFIIPMSGNDKEENVEAVLAFVFGIPIDIFPVATDVTGDGGDFDFDPDSINADTEFDWSYSGAIPLAFLTVKASNGFAIFDVMGTTMGSIDLDGIIMNEGGNTPDVSHVGFWTTNPIPEPSTLMLVGLGLAGLALWGRRQAS